MAGAISGTRFQSFWFSVFYGNSGWFSGCCSCPVGSPIVFSGLISGCLSGSDLVILDYWLFSGYCLSSPVGLQGPMIHETEATEGVGEAEHGLNKDELISDKEGLEDSETDQSDGLESDSDMGTYSGNTETGKLELSVNSFEGFIRFMKCANNNYVVLKNREIFRECFEAMLKWFHNTYIEGDVTKLMPPTIAGSEICLFDLYKLVKCYGGYDRINYKGKWHEVALGLGFSGIYGLRFKEIYVHYLLIPEGYYEVGRVCLTSTEEYIKENCLSTKNMEVLSRDNQSDMEGTSHSREQKRASNKGKAGISSHEEQVK